VHRTIDAVNMSAYFIPQRDIIFSVFVVGRYYMYKREALRFSVSITFCQMMMMVNQTDGDNNTRQSL